MRALRVVGITEGGGECSVVLEDSQRRERFTVPADEQLRAAARGDLTRLGQIAIELESQLRPREIQARIRAGASVEQVAAAAGVPMAKIERFAYPVLLERSRTAEVAQRAHPLRADGPDRRVLADVVLYTFGLRGQEYQSAEWDSWKGEDGRWIVALSWRAGRSDIRALWAFQPGAHGGTVTAIDEHAHDLVEGLPVRPLRTVGPVIDISRPEESAPTSAPEGGHELRAAASDIAARRDIGDWARTTPEPRRGETARRSPERSRTDPVEVSSRSVRGDEPSPRAGHPRPGRTDDRTAGDDAPRGGPRQDGPERSDEPATDRPAAPRPSADGRLAEPAAARTEAGSQASRPTTADPAPPQAVPPPRPNTLDGAAAPTAGPAADAAPSAGTADDEPGDSTPAAAPEIPAPPQASSVQPASEQEPPEQASSPQPPEQPSSPQPPEQPSSEQATAEPTAPPKRTRKGKPVMPSWDEVLLGVRSQR